MFYVWDGVDFIIDMLNCIVWSGVNRCLQFIFLMSLGLRIINLINGSFSKLLLKIITYRLYNGLSALLFY